MLKRLLTFATHRIYNLPVLVLMPHSRCNCRCVMCDIWKANQDKTEITEEALRKHVSTFEKLGVREVVLSGGEALMHTNLWKLCSLLRERRMEITILSTGLLLERNASEIVSHCRDVIVSLDGSQPIHDRIRNIPQAFDKLAAGVRALKHKAADFKVTARCVLQRHNYKDFNNILAAARQIGLDQISFLAADVSTAAFNRTSPWTGERVSEIALSKEETVELEKIVMASFTGSKEAYRSGFIAESPAKMKKIVQYYKAINGMGEFPEVVCNAPWVSAVLESDGSLLPCFFHKTYGNVNEHEFLEVINSPEAIRFRANLRVKHNPVCKKCVCSLNIGFAEMN